jgi:hypothetical protein
MRRPATPATARRITNVLREQHHIINGLRTDLGEDNKESCEPDYHHKWSDIRDPVSLRRMEAFEQQGIRHDRD